VALTIPKLGELKRIDAREVWNHEALHFTPWLKQNLDLLAKALHIDLELPETEVAVGEFSCDIVAQDSTTGEQVVIENQLEQTDHSHLGQAITYAAGQDARTVVWISSEFREPHRQAIDWLNANTRENLDFFGVEIELLQIDESDPAPHFKVVAQPNNWQKTIKTKVSQPSEKGLLYQRFWTDLRAAYAEKYPGHPNARYASPRSWIIIASAGRTGFVYRVAFTKNSQLEVQLRIDVRDYETNKEVFEALASNRDQIESLVGISLTWERLDHSRSSRVLVHRPAIVTDPSPLREQHIDWAADMLGKLRDALTPRLSNLVLDAKDSLAQSSSVFSDDESEADTLTA
jgi:hypothetical protein